MGSIQSRQAAIGYRNAGQRPCCRTCKHAAEVFAEHASPYDAPRWECGRYGFKVTAMAICDKHEANGHIAAPTTKAAPIAVHFDLVAHLRRQRDFSERTFGPGARLHGVLDHIRKELVEVEESSGSLAEWVDVILLAFDGAWRAGNTPEQIAEAISAKQTKNEARTWPDWRTVQPGKAIEHIRTEGT